MNFEKKTYENILDNLYDGLYFVNRKRVITYWNKAAERISGFSADEVVGRSCADNILNHVDSEGRHLCTGMCPLAATMLDGRFRQTEVFMHHRHGHRLPVSVRTSPMIDADGHIVGGIELFTDISHQAVNEMRIRELEKLAFLDRLTRLANRHFIEMEIDHRFEEKKRYRIPFGVLFMDIDHFKNFNDTYGHDVGDEVLKLVANTFLSNARPFDLFGRWGGEEFICIARNVDVRELQSVGNRLRLMIETSYLMHDNQKLNVTISMGATMAGNKDTPESLVKRADSLLYDSKTAGRNRVTFG
jgi:diguanylate cyclase (GGDEF)-like protein/PAS domain S-box-containing protein